MAFYNEGNRRFFYRDSGCGPVVVLLHGLASHSKDWEKQIEALSGDYRIIAPDFRGHGESGPAPGPFSMKDLAIDVKSLLTHLGIEAYHLVGFSLGGMVAFELALIDQRRLTSLVVINSGPGVAAGYWRIYWRVKIELAIRKAIIRCLSMRRLSKIIGEKILPSPEHSEQRRQFEKQMTKMNKRTYVNILNAIGRFNVYDRVHTLKTPTLIISSDQDYTPLSVKEEYAKLMTNAKVELIKNSRHATPIDQPEALNRSITRFFQSLSIITPNFTKNN